MTELNITPERHSSIVGGSTAARMLGCPGHVDLIAKLPEAVLRQTSSYADEGTGLHAVMAYLVNEDVQASDLHTDPEIDRLFEEHGLKEERFFDCVIPAFHAFNDYLDRVYKEEGEDIELLVRVESEVQMPGIEGAFGTCDVLIRTPSKTVVWDWKFGAGVPVYASYTVPANDGHGTVDMFGNPQLLFYGRGALHTAQEYFQPDGNEAVPLDREVELVICAPRMIEDTAISVYTTDVQELMEFQSDLIAAVEEAQAGGAEKAVGSWCRFAPCKTICPLHGNAPGKVVELGAKLRELQLRTAAAKEGDTPVLVPFENARAVDYPGALAAMLDLAEIAEPYLKEAQKQAHAFMEAGGKVPGYKLVPKRAAHDSWNDEKKVDGFLARQGLDIETRRKPWEPITPAVARTKIKALGGNLKQLETYVKPGVSSGTTLAPSDDPRPEVLTAEGVIKALADKIGSLNAS